MIVSLTASASWPDKKSGNRTTGDRRQTPEDRQTGVIYIYIYFEVLIYMLFFVDIIFQIVESNGQLCPIL